MRWNRRFTSWIAAKQICSNFDAVVSICTKISGMFAALDESVLQRIKAEMGSNLVLGVLHQRTASPCGGRMSSRTITLALINSGAVHEK